MAIGTPLATLVEMLADECGTSSASSRGIDNRAYFIRIIQRVYETLSDSFDWTFLRVDNDDATKVLEAGSRYYDFPVAMDLRSTTIAYLFYNNVWVPMRYGIDEMNYNQMNPELDQRADPQTRWRVKDESQFEVWPLPASNGNKVRFRGKRLQTPLTSDQARATMDDQLIVLYAASEILSKSSQKDAEIKLAAAKDRMAICRRMYSDRNKIRIGMGAGDEATYGWPRVIAAKAAN
jgi:hypothetical protein